MFQLCAKICDEMTFVEAWAKKKMLQNVSNNSHFEASILFFRPSWMSFHHEILYAGEEFINVYHKKTKLYLFLYLFTVHQGACELGIKNSMSCILICTSYITFDHFFVSFKTICLPNIHYYSAGLIGVPCF